MKHVQASLLIVATLALSAVSAQSAMASGSNYPFIMWNDQAFDKAQEHSELVGPANVLDSLKATVEAKKMEQVLVVVKEGLHTRELIQNVASLKMIKDRILAKSHTYINVEQGFSNSEFERVFGRESNQYTLQTIDELSVLLE